MSGQDDKEWADYYRDQALQLSRERDALRAEVESMRAVVEAAAVAVEAARSIAPKTAALISAVDARRDAAKKVTP